jgi:membrane protease YdiL (CAAX protease family)
VKNVFTGLIIAAVFWFIMFSPWTKDSVNFWVTMTIAALILIAYGLTSGKHYIKTYFGIDGKLIFIGLASAVVLYLIFYAGNFFSSLLFDFSRNQIESIYSTKAQASKIYIAAALLFIIGPAEEIFWRGYIQHNFMAKYGETKGFIIATLIYAFVHIWSFNFMLIMAALICGLFWGWMFLKFKSLVPVIISHAVWDVAIFVFIPISV